MERLIACYKAYRGGEWFESSLESIRPYTDGAVVVFSDGPWLDRLTLPENCREPLRAFCCKYPDYPIVHGAHPLLGTKHNTSMRWA